MLIMESTCVYYILTILFHIFQFQITVISFTWNFRQRVIIRYAQLIASQIFITRVLLLSRMLNLQVCLSDYSPSHQVCLFIILYKTQSLTLAMQKEQSSAHYNLHFDQRYLTHELIREESELKNSSEQEELAGCPEHTFRREKKSLRTDEVDDLNLKRQNLEQFMNRIGEISNQPIRNDILDHCIKVSIRIPRNLNKLQVIKLAKNRVDKQIQAYARMIKNKRIKKNWSQEDINILIWVISKYCQFHGISCIRDGICDADWASIAELIPGVTGKSCMFKWLSLKKSNLAENSWVEEESLLLDQMVKKYGQNSWCRISEELYLKNNFPNKVYRCPKQCREHWNCYLNPQLKKGPWERREDYLLLRAVKQLNGVKKWAEIVKLFNGRTENALKNRFTLIVEKEMKEQKSKKKLTQFELVELYLGRFHNSFPIEQQKLQFLMEKREQIEQSQIRKKPKKTRPKKQKQAEAVKPQQKEQQQEEYVPDDYSVRDRTGMKPGKGRAFVPRIFETESRSSRYMSERELRDETIFRQSRKKQEQIFESDSDEEIRMHDEPEPEMNDEGKKSQQIVEEAVSTPRIILSGGNWAGSEEGQNDGKQNLNLRQNQLCIVPFSKQILESLKNRLLIPCSMVKNNDTVQLKRVSR